MGMQSLRHAALAGIAILAAALAPAQSHAQVDATGTFSASGFPVGDTLSFRQTGSTLSMCVPSGLGFGVLVAGTIDAMTGAFDLDLVVPLSGSGVAWCSLTLTGVVAPDGASFTATWAQETTCVPPPFSCSPACQPTGGGAVVGTRLSTAAPACCGDGVLDPGELCDDGNGYAGDCCSGCTPNVGGQCASDADPCTTDACEAGVCTHVTIPLCTTTTTVSTTTPSTSSTTTTMPAACAPAPLAGCRPPTQPGKATLRLKDATPDQGGLAVWKWTKGVATALADFGDPLATTGYALCVYDAAGAPRLVLRAPPAGTCGTKPCWRRAQGSAFVYADRERTPDGVAKLRLGSGDAGAARITLVAKDEKVPMPPVAGLAPPLRVQLQGNGRCWEASFSLDRSPQPAVFDARSD